MFNELELEYETKASERFDEIDIEKIEVSKQREEKPEGKPEGKPEKKEKKEKKEKITKKVTKKSK